MSIILLTIVYYTQYIYYSVFNYFASVIKLKNLPELFHVKESTYALFNMKHILFLIPLLIIIIFSFLGSKNFEKSPLNFYKRFLICFFSFLALAFLNQINFFYFQDNNKSIIWSPNMYIERYGVIDYFFQDIFLQVNPPKTILDNKTEIMNEFQLNKIKNEYSDIYKGKNLVFITAESLAPFGIDETLTPTLYRMKHEGISFNNHYVTTTTTFESEYTFLKGFKYSDKRQGNLDTYGFGAMPHLFKDKGYKTAAFHNNTRYFYDRPIYYSLLGFDNFYGSEDLNIVIDEGSSLNGGGDAALDIEVFENSMPIINQISGPFFSYYMTFSGHAPYDQNIRKSLANNIEKVKALYSDMDEQLQIYLAAQMSFDQGLAKLLEEMKLAGKLPNTVFVIVGDHYPYVLNEEVMMENYNIENKLDLYKTPFIIWDGTQKNQEIDTIISSESVLPTLANMFNLDLSYSYGRDAFVPRENTLDVEWGSKRNYSYIIDNNKRDLNGVSASLVIENPYVQLSKKRMELAETDFVLQGFKEGE